MGHSSRSRKRRLWRRLGDWWRQRRKNYHVVPDVSTDPAAEATRQLMNPSSSTEARNEEETIFEVITEDIPEAAPSQDSSKSRPILQAVAAVPASLPPRIPVMDKPPPLPPKKVHSILPAPLAKQPSLTVPDPFLRRRTKDSFQGSLESIDSLIESYWDPEEDGSLATPVATNIVQSMDFLEEHVDFLKVQTQPRSVEVVWETEDVWDIDDFS